MTPPVIPEIRLATPADARQVGETIADAFHDDPVTRWVVPPPEDRPSVLPGYFGAAGETAIETGSVYVAGDFAAVAVWFDATTPPPPPPSTPDPAMVGLCGRYAENFHLLEKLMHDAQPSKPAHHHLAFLAVRDGLRGHGIGSALLARHHEQLDTEDLGSYLDASSPRSRRLYLRHGYHDLPGPCHLTDGTPLWPMWRPPGGGASAG